MSYTSPTPTASGETLAGLKTHGFAGQVEKIIAANSFSPSVVAMLRYPPNRQADRFFDHLSQSITKYLRGANVSHATIAAELLDYATVLKVQLQAVEEIAVLEAAATRTVTTTINASGTQFETKVGLS